MKSKTFEGKNGDINGQILSLQAVFLLKFAQCGISCSHLYSFKMNTFKACLFIVLLAVFVVLSIEFINDLPNTLCPGRVSIDSNQKLVMHLKNLMGWGWEVGVSFGLKGVLWSLSVQIDLSEYGLLHRWLFPHSGLQSVRHENGRFCWICFAAVLCKNVH